jgi:hypothetical protein
VSGLGLLLIVCGSIMVLSTSASLTTVIAGALGALLIVVVSAKVDVGAMIRTLEGLRILVPIAAFSIVGAMIGARKGTLQFDEIGAQLIVVLLLALALEARFFRIRGDEERFDALGTLFVMALLAVGELYAMSGVLGGEPRHAEMVGGAIAAGFAAVAVSAVLGPTRAEAKVDR